jgi:hypothetical protein
MLDRGGDRVGGGAAVDRDDLVARCDAGGRDVAARFDRGDEQVIDREHGVEPEAKARVALRGRRGLRRVVREVIVVEARERVVDRGVVAGPRRRGEQAPLGVGEHRVLVEVVARQLRGAMRVHRVEVIADGAQLGAASGLVGERAALAIGIMIRPGRIGQRHGRLGRRRRRRPRGRRRCARGRR